jgi:hypothetical protein
VLLICFALEEGVVYGDFEGEAVEKNKPPIWSAHWGPECASSKGKGRRPAYVVVAVRNIGVSLFADSLMPAYSHYSATSCWLVSQVMLLFTTIPTRLKRLRR